MSRIGKLPINIPSGVTVTVNGDQVNVKGPKGELSQVITGGITVTTADLAMIKNTELYTDCIVL